MKMTSSTLEMVGQYRYRLLSPPLLVRKQQISPSTRLNDLSRTSTEAGHDQDQHRSKSACMRPTLENVNLIESCSMLVPIDSKQKPHDPHQYPNHNLPDSCHAPSHLPLTAVYQDVHNQAGNFHLIWLTPPTRDELCHRIWRMHQTRLHRTQDGRHGGLETKDEKRLRLAPADQNCPLNQLSSTIPAIPTNPPPFHDSLSLQHVHQANVYRPTVVLHLLLQLCRTRISETRKPQKCILQLKRHDYVDRQKRKKGAQRQIGPSKRQKSWKPNMGQSQQSLRRKLPLPYPLSHRSLQ